MSSFAQQKVLQGKVVSKSDYTGIAHVLIKLEGEDIQGYTNKDGAFSINVPIKKSYVINASKLGYVSSTTTVPFENEPLIVLSESMSEIEEVIVNTGYQQLPKERATGSFEVVDNKLFNRQIGTDVISRLDGIMPSMLFDKRQGNEQNMIVRGVGSLGMTDTKPLIIVDNFPFEGDINSLNPNDVESITLLKDAAAASIWGAKAGNGVLVITTKKGKFGMGWNLSMTANTMLTEKPDLYYFPQMSSSEFIDVERFLFEKGAFNSVLNNVTSRPPVTPVVELLNKFRNKEINEADLESKLNSYRQIDLRSDMDKYLYRMGINQQYALNLSGGGEKYSSFYSLGYDRNLNPAVGSEFSRISINLQNTIKPINRLEVSLGFRYGITNTSSNQLGTLQMQDTRSLYPYARLVDDSGNALVVEKDYRVSYLDQVEDRGHLLDWRYRPYDELRLADNNSIRNNMLLQSRIKYEVINGLSAEVNYQYEYQPGTDQRFYSEETYYTRNFINRYTQVNGSTILRPVPLGGILDRTPNKMGAHSLRGQVNYDFQRDQHSVYVLAGMEVRQAMNNSNSYRVYGYNPETLNTGIVNFVDRFPIYDNLSGASTINYLNNESSILNRFISYFSNASYSYDNRYTISGSVRKDASNLFGLATNDKWTPLWSVGGIWNLAKESFYNLDILPVLKFRSTYGYSGNIANRQSAVTTIEYRGNSRIGRFPYAIVKNPPNPALRWEKVGTFNLGVDFGFKGGRFSGSIEYYQKTSKDLFSTVDSNPTTGFSYLGLNSGTIRNTGLDVSLQHRYSKGDLNWTSNFMLSLNKNKVLAYFVAQPRVSSRVGSGSTVSPIIGQPTYPIVSYKWGGLDPENGNPIGFVDGIKSTDYALIQQNATTDDIVFHGSALPEYFGAFRNTLDWKGLSLSVNITYRLGNYFRRETINYATLLSANGQVGHGDYTLRWQNPGDELKTTIPSMVYPTNSRRDDFYRNSEVVVEKADHIRLQDINLSYSFPFKNGNSMLKSLRATAYMKNVGILWRANKSGLDPDVRQLPMARVWSFGLTSNF